MTKPPTPGAPKGPESGVLPGTPAGTPAKGPGIVPGTPDEKGRTGYGSLERVVITLTDHLAHRKFVCGEAFSAADVYLGSQIGWGLRFGSLPGNDTLRAYWDRISTRPALVAANAIDDALLPPRT